MHLDIKVDGLPLLQRSFVVIWWSNVAAPSHSHWDSCALLLNITFALGAWCLVSSSTSAWSAEGGVDHLLSQALLSHFCPLASAHSFPRCVLGLVWTWTITL